MDFALTDAASLPAASRRQMATILHAAFTRWPGAWPNLADAEAELAEFAADPARIWRAAVDPGGRVLGWIGGLEQYDGRVWELHPLAVDPACQRQGVGKALVADFERLVAARGGLTVMLGSDDESSLTSLGGLDLFPNPLEKLQQIKNLHDHPYSFYLKLGYEFIGVVPDANGFGKPDLLMAKRVGRS